MKRLAACQPLFYFSEKRRLMSCRLFFFNQIVNNESKYAIENGTTEDPALVEDQHRYGVYAQLLSLA